MSSTTSVLGMILFSLHDGYVVPFAILGTLKHLAFHLAFQLTSVIKDFKGIFSRHVICLDDYPPHCLFFDRHVNRHFSLFWTTVPFIIKGIFVLKGSSQYLDESSKFLDCLTFGQIFLL